MTIFRLASAATLGLALAGTAFAADLPMRSAPPPFVAPLPVFTWTGFYAGVNGGYVFDSSTRFRSNDAVFGGVPQTNARVSDDGFTAGGQIGYNYQFGAGNGIVVGVEADANYVDLDRAIGVAYFPGEVRGTQTFGTTGVAYRGSLDFLGTVRGRVGYAFNQFLIYGTGGFAYGDVSNSVNVFTPPGGGLFATGGNGGLQTGYTYGGGIEYALPTGSFLNFFKSSAVTLKVEYLHYDLGDETIAVGTGAVTQYTSKVSNEGDLVRAGINYKF